MLSAEVLPVFPNKVRVGVGLISHDPRCSEQDGEGDHEFEKGVCLGQIKFVYLVLQLPNLPLQQQLDYVGDCIAASLGGPKHTPHARATLESVRHYQQYLREESHPRFFGYAEGDMAFFFRSKKVDMVKPAAELLHRLWQPPKLQKVRYWWT